MASSGIQQSGDMFLSLTSERGGCVLFWKISNIGRILNGEFTNRYIQEPEHIILFIPYQKWCLTLPTMHLDCRQFRQRVRPVMRVAVNVAASLNQKEVQYSHFYIHTFSTILFFFFFSDVASCCLRLSCTWAHHDDYSWWPTYLYILRLPENK